MLAQELDDWEDARLKWALAAVESEVVGGEGCAGEEVRVYEFGLTLITRKHFLTALGEQVEKAIIIELPLMRQLMHSPLLNRL